MGYRNHRFGVQFRNWAQSAATPGLCVSEPAGWPRSGQAARAAQKGIGISTRAGGGAQASTRWATTWPTSTIEGEAKASSSA